MALDNLPPGVTPGMIPGNSAADVEWDHVIDEMVDWCQRNGLEPIDALHAIKGNVPDKVVRGFIHCEVAAAYNEGRTSVLMVHKEELDDHGPCRIHIYEE